MGRVKELLPEWDDTPDDAYDAGFYVHSLDNAVRDLDQFSTDQLANEISDLEEIADRMRDVVARVQLRIEKLKARENYHAATSRYR